MSATTSRSPSTSLTSTLPSISRVRLAPWFGVAKVGLELYSAAGPEAIERLRALDLAVFADLKLHDIPNTVERAARVLGGLGVGFLNFHTAGGVAMLQAGLAGLAEGAAAAGHAPPFGLGVTVLTSDEDTSAFAVASRRGDHRGLRRRRVFDARSRRGEARARASSSRSCPAFGSRPMTATTNAASAHRSKSRPPAPTCSSSDAQLPRPTIRCAWPRPCTRQSHARSWASAAIVCAQARPQLRRRLGSLCWPAVAPHMLGAHDR